MRRTLIALLLWLPSAHAHNNLFLPGDAYFSIAVTPDFLTKLDKGNEPTIHYARFATMFMYCGYAGCWNAKVTNLPEKTRKNLTRTLRQLFKEEPKKARTVESDEETTQYFPVLIYNRDFDFNKFPVGLKFNEEFEKAQIKKAKKDHGVDDRIASKKLRRIDAKYAKKIRPLETISIPRDLDAFMGVNEPIVLDGSKISFVVLLGGTTKDLEDHAAQKPGLEMLIIGDTVTRIKHD